MKYSKYNKNKIRVAKGLKEFNHFHAGSSFTISAEAMKVAIYQMASNIIAEKQNDISINRVAQNSRITIRTGGLLARD